MYNALLIKSLKIVVMDAQKKLKKKLCNQKLITNQDLMFRFSTFNWLTLGFFHPLLSYTIFPLRFPNLLRFILESLNNNKSAILAKLIFYSILKFFLNVSFLSFRVTVHIFQDYLYVFFYFAKKKQTNRNNNKTTLSKNKVIYLTFYVKKLLYNDDLWFCLRNKRKITIIHSKYSTFKLIFIVRVSCSFFQIVFTSIYTEKKKYSDFYYESNSNREIIYQFPNFYLSPQEFLL